MSTKKLSNANLQKNFHLSVIAFPAIVLVFIFSYIPMFGIILAFKNINFREGIFNSPWSGFKNFDFFLRNDAFAITRNTLLYNTAFIFVGLVFALIFALLLNELRSRNVTKIYQTAFFFPYFFSWVIVAYMVYSFLAPHGILPSTVGSIFGFELTEFYVTPGIWPGFLIFINTWKNLGYMSVLYYAAIMGIPQDFYEAASIDGATRLQQMWSITLPHLKPLISIMTLLNIGQIFRADFGLFFFIPREIGKLAEITRVLDVHVYRILRLNNDIGVSTAIGLYQSVLCFVIVIMANYVAKRIDPDYAMF